MRIAWLGPDPALTSGVPYVAAQLPAALARLGVEVDCFLTMPESDLPKTLVHEPRVRIFVRARNWAWGRWYSRGALPAFITGQSARAVAQLRLGRLIAREHEARPYDVVYQFSQIEATGLRRVRHLAPIVIHPQVHAAGELRWHRAERRLARRCESTTRTLAVRSLLEARALAQRRDLRLSDAVVAPSSRFAELLAADYGVSRARIHVVPNPIDVERYSPGKRESRGGLTLLFVSRMSVRKGVERVVELSHQLADLRDRLRLLIVGSRSLWSDYRPLLSGLDASTAEYLGELSEGSLADLYRSADVLVQPSRYEPFGLTVGEALASGTPVVASDQVGAVEGVDPVCCRVFPDGDPPAFERAVRELVDELSGARGGAIRQRARSEAVRLYSLEVVGRQIAQALDAVAGA